MSSRRTSEPAQTLTLAPAPAPALAPFSSATARRPAFPLPFGLAVLAACTTLALGAGCPENPPKDPFHDAPDIAALDEQSLFTFAIFSDNKGTAPATALAMTGMVDGVDDMNAEFVIGLGDHVKGPPEESRDFPAWLAAHPAWAERFYPVIADGENAYYGTGQGDWGAGRGLIDDLALCDRPNVTCRDNHAEYHAVLPVGDLTIHFVVAHYPDTGDDRFPEESRQYLVDEVQAIPRTGREIIIAAAHTGNWLRDLSEAQRQSLLDSCDLLLGASTHIYTRYDYPDDKALFVNTGSVGFSLWNGYLQVNVLDDPLRLVLQYMMATIPRTLQAGDNCWVKEVGGPITPCDFSHGEEWPPLFPD